METSQEYLYAFADSNNTIVAVLLFDNIADETLLVQVKEQLNAVEAILCDNDNQISVGFVKIDNKYYPPKPEDDLENSIFYGWNEETLSWVEVNGD